MDAYDIKLTHDGNGWIARFVTPGGPDVSATGLTPDGTLNSLAIELWSTISTHGSIDAIPRLPEVES